MTMAQLVALVDGEARCNNSQRSATAAPTPERGTVADLMAMHALIP